MIYHFLKLCLLLLLASSYSKANVCLPAGEQAGLCTPGVTITEEVQVDVTEEDYGTEIVTTTTTTTTTTTQTVTNENSGDILDGTNGYVNSSKEGDMDIDWGGQGPANMPSGSNCYALGTDKCAQITGSGNSTSTMGVDGMGTTFIQTVDISDLNIQNGGEVKYSIEVDKRDAQDRIYMHITGLNGTSQVFSGTDILSETGVSSGYQSYNGSFDFSGILNKVTIEVGGRDINLAIGPLFDDVTVDVFYNVISTIIEQQITTVEQIYYLNIFDGTEIDYVEEVFEFNDVIVDDGFVDFVPIEPETEEVSYETVEMEIEFEMDFNMDFAPPPPMEFVPMPESVTVEMPVNIETVTMEIEMEMELDLPPMPDNAPPPPDMVASAEDMPPPMEEMSPPPDMEETPPPMESEPEPIEIETEEAPPPIEETKEEVPVEETEPEPVEEETNEKPQEESQEPEPEEQPEPQKEKDQEEEQKEEKPLKPKVSKKEKAATKIVKKIDDKARYDDAAQIKTLIVMQILGNTKTFFDTQTMIVDTNVEEYLNKTIEDQYGMLFNMAQDQTLNEMVDAQWQKSQ